MRRFRSIDKIWAVLSSIGVIRHANYLEFLEENWKWANEEFAELHRQFPYLVKHGHEIWRIVRE